MEARIAVMAPPAEVEKVVERSIDGPGGPMTLRIYTPKGAGLFPLMVFFHGSGFVLCSLDTHDGMCRNLAAGIGCVVVSVDYRLAPEHKFPAGPDDCLAATRWAAAHAAEIGADPARIMLAGDSAGGNMAAVTALRVRDEGGPALVGQMLLYPVTDYHTPGTPSYAENAEGYGLTRDTMEWFWAHYLGTAAQADHPHASPVRAPDLSRLPAAYVVSAEYDTLRDEAERYGDRLRAGGSHAPARHESRVPVLGRPIRRRRHRDGRGLRLGALDLPTRRIESSDTSASSAVRFTNMSERRQRLALAPRIVVGHQRVDCCTLQLSATAP